MVVFNAVKFGMYESLKSEDATFMEKITSPEYRAVQEHFIATLLGRSRERQTDQRRPPSRQ